MVVYMWWRTVACMREEVEQEGEGKLEADVGDAWGAMRNRHKMSEGEVWVLHTKAI